MNFFTIKKDYISYIGDDFLTKIALIDDVEKSGVNLKTFILARKMEVEEVISELTPKEVTPGEIVWLIKNDPRILTDGSNNIFFIIGTDGNLWSALAYKYEDGWHFKAVPPYNTKSCNCRLKWLPGCKVFYK